MSPNRLAFRRKTGQGKTHLKAEQQGPELPNPATIRENAMVPVNRSTLEEVMMPQRRDRAFRDPAGNLIRIQELF